MAKAPSKRRGITLDPRAASAAALEELSAQMAAPAFLPSDQTPSAVAPAGDDAVTTPKAILERLEELRRRDAELDIHRRHPAEQLQAQLPQLEEQREQIASLARQLKALEQTRRTSARIGVLLSLLSLSAIAALGFHTWPRLQDVAGDLNRVSLGVSRLAPELQAVRGDVTALTSDLGQMGGAVDSLRKDVSDVRSGLGSLRQAVDTLPPGRDPVQADTGGRRGAAQTLPHTATTMSNPYRPMRPRMPW
ncbi:MAG: hypothetical protein ACM3ST_16135 [Bdellovibrio bacteriovorus]